MERLPAFLALIFIILLAGCVQNPKEQKTIENVATGIYEQPGEASLPEIENISVDKLDEEEIVTERFGDLLITYDRDEWEALPMDRWLKRWIKVKNTGKEPITIYFEVQEKVREKNGSTDWKQSGSWFPQPWTLDIEPGEELTLWHFIDFTPFKVPPEELGKKEKVELRMLIRNERTGEQKFVYFTNSFIKDFQMINNSLLAVKIVNSRGEPVKDARVEVTSIYIPEEYRASYRSDSQDRVFIPLFAHRYRDSKALHGYSLRFEKPGYYEKYAVIFPEVGEKRSITVKLREKAEDMHYKLEKCLDTGYETWYVKVKDSCIVFAHGHYKGEGNPVSDERHGIYFLDRSGNLIWKKHTPHAVWGIDVSDDCSLVFAMQLREERGFMLDKNGNVLWQTEERLGWPYHVETREVKISHNKRYVAVGAGDGWLYLANAKNGEVLWRKNLRGQIRQIAFSKDDALLFASAGDGYLYKIDVKSGDILGKAYVETWLYRNSLSISEDEKYALTVSKIGRACFVDLEKMHTEWCFDTRGGGHATDMQASGKLLAVASGGSYGRIVFSSNGTPLWYISKPSWHVQVVNNSYVLFGTMLLDFEGNLIYDLSWEYPELGDLDFSYLSDDLEQFITMKDGKICLFRRSYGQKVEEKAEKEPLRLLDASRIDKECYFLDYGEFGIYVFRNYCKGAEGKHRISYGNVVFQFDDERAGEIVNELAKDKKALDKLMNNLEKLGNKIILLRSRDGINWEETRTIITRDATVPDILVDFDGNLRVYFVKFPWNVVRVAISGDGREWKEFETNLEEGFVDPEVVKVNGKYRLYTNVGDVFDSEDGFEFERTGKAPPLMDPAVFKANNEWYLLGWNEKGVFEFSSENGIDSWKEIPAGIDAKICDSMENNGEIWIYCSSKDGIMLFRSRDGVSWDKGALVYAGSKISDPSVAEFNGMFYMALTVMSD